MFVVVEGDDVFGLCKEEPAGGEEADEVQKDRYGGCGVACGGEKQQECR